MLAVMGRRWSEVIWRWHVARSVAVGVSLR